ncbi:MAG: pentapeptide repeat-containing protein [Ktedonobacteraceae bacterium]
MQDHPSSSTLPFNTNDSETWKAYWKEQGQPWRTEPAIDEERQQQLLSNYQGSVDTERGKYPFKGVRLSRADVEYLLAMEEQKSAELSPRGGTAGKQHRSFGLDLRGVDLSHVNLSNLPLMRLHAGLSLKEGRHATVEQSRAAAANLAKADLSNAQLQGAQLSRVSLDEAVLVETHLEGADLGKASLKQAILAGTHLERADLTKAQLEGSTLLEAHLEGAMLQGAYLDGANLFEAHLEGARLVGAHLEGTSLVGTHFEGKALGGDELKRLRAWIPHFPEVLPAADLREVFLNNRTHLDEIHVGNDQYGYIALADVHWGDVNLTVVDWAGLKRLGDETVTRSLKVEEEDTQLGERGLPARAERAVDMLLRAQEVSDVVVSYVMRSPTLTKKIRERVASSSPAQPETQQQLERERFRAAVRANRQLAVVLRAQVLQRRVLWRSGARFYGSYFFSCFLDVLAGYGYKPGRTLIAYILTILSFAIIYFSLGLLAGYQASISPLYALIISIISFHGRGFFPGGFLPTLPMAVFAACEAIIGFTIEISFIATFTQRYFGK